MSWVVVDHPLLVPHKVQLVLLEALLSEVLHSTMGHLAQSPGVAPGMVSADIPLDLLVSGIITSRWFYFYNLLDQLFYSFEITYVSQGLPCWFQIKS